MKKFAIAALLAGTVLVPVTEAAQVVFTSPAWRDASYGGGEFAADILGSGGNPDFYTFCLERNEGLSFGAAYNYTTSNAAEAGGVGGGNPDPISQGTAFLFSEFSAGTLSGYSYATGNPVANAARAVSGRILQNAIWALEQEQAVDNSNPYIQLVVATFGSVASAMADNTSYAVGVLNPTKTGSVTDPFYRRQSVLINLPDNGVAVIMLGGSLMLLGAARRRLA